MNALEFKNYFRSRTSRWVLMLSGIVLGVIATGDRPVFGIPTGEQGIDPLDVLSTKVRPNVYIVLDSSGSMDEAVDSNGSFNDDEPNSKLAQAKAVVNQIVADNQTIASFALGRYKGAVTTMPTTKRFVYSTDDVESTGILSTSALFDLRQFKLTANDTITFTENGTLRVSPAVAGGASPIGDYNTGWDLAIATQNALNGTAGKTNTYKVTFIDGPGGTDARFAITTTNANPANTIIKGSSIVAELRQALGLPTGDTPLAITLTAPSNAGTINLAAADAFTFTENGTTRNATLAAGNYSSVALLVTAFQNALNAAPGKTNTYRVTLISSKLVVDTTNATPVPFVINGASFTAAVRTATGMGSGNVSSVSAAMVEPSGTAVAKTAYRDSTTTYNDGPRQGRTGAPTNVRWAYADKFFTDATLQIDSATGTPCAVIPFATPSLTSASLIVQPMTTCDPAGSPVTTGTPFTFKFNGAQWSNSAAACQGLDPLVGMGACSNDMQIGTIGPYLAPTIAIAGGAIAGYTDNFLGTITFTTNSSVPEQVGIRTNSATPIADSLTALYTEFYNIWNNASTGVKLQPVGKRQKSFVIFVTDGDDTCERATGTAGEKPTDSGFAATAFSGSNLDAHALRAAYSAQELYNGTSISTGGTWPPSGARDPESKVTTFVILFGVGAQASRGNYIAYGGTGMVRPTTGAGFATRWSAVPTAAQIAACTTCKPAYTAATAASLASALQGAINLTQDGEFSDQQSITETVYEYVAIAAPAPPAVPPTPTPAIMPLQDPINPLGRYSRTLPILLQSTFVMPNFQGHLKAFRNSGGTGSLVWDAGQKIEDRVVNGVTGTDGMGTSEWTFAQLRGDGTLANTRTSTAKIKRRVFSTRMNGKLTSSEYTPQTLVDQSVSLAGPSGGFERVALWPPSTAVSPADAADSPGILDTVLGISSAASVAAVQLIVPDACKAATAGSCFTGTAAVKLARAQREAREIVLAWIAGATPRRVLGNPKRVVGGANEILYEARPWVMAESTLAAPGLIGPPPQAATNNFKLAEYILYRDGARKGTGSGDPCPPTDDPVPNGCFSVNGVNSGFGLRNPDVDGSALLPALTATNDVSLKPMMSVVYHATNAGLHAFRAGPCPAGAYSSRGNSLSLGCKSGTVESGGEELWAFVPFDQLGKLPLLLTPQKNDANKVYMLAAPVRFSDVFIDGSWTKGLGTSPSKTVTATGVWRTMAFFGRGIGGKAYTGMDVTVSGTVGTHSLDTALPIVVWSRGNPDLYDATNFAKMGYTWSVPSVGRVDPADFAGNDHMLFVGSGYSSVAAEGQTFFAISPRNGDIVKAFTVASGTQSAAAPFRNSLVASPSLHSENADGTGPLDYSFTANYAETLVKAVYFPDLHGRVWKYSTAAPTSPPVIMADARAADGVDQPFANSVALLKFYPTPAASPAPPAPVHVFVESGNDHRIPLRTSGTPFRLYGYRDEGSYTIAPYLVRNLGLKFRGQSQPATAFARDPRDTSGTNPVFPVVFFSGNEFSTSYAGCISQFNGVLFALNAATNSAAYDLSSSTLNSDDEFVTLNGNRINDEHVTTGGQLVLDLGLGQGAPPTPPDSPDIGYVSGVGDSASAVYTGGDAANPAHANFRTTAVPYRLGTSSCRANQ
ncbi:MAG: hypothetical protein ABI672_12185 [Vicinamibacteria bacterium]